jgi:hypothetical protein
VTKLIRRRRKPDAERKPALGPVHQLVMKVMADAERNGETSLTLEVVETEPVMKGQTAST